MDIDKKRVGNMIKKIRISHGLTMEEFGTKVDNAHKSLVSKWEKGMSLPNNNRLKIIADLGQISIEEVLYGENYYKLTIGLKVYDTLLKEFPELSECSKAEGMFGYSNFQYATSLRYFNKDTTEALIIKSIDNVLRRKNTKINLIKDEAIFLFEILEVFTNEYTDNVKTNHNLISRVLTIALENDDYISNYQTYKRLNDFTFNSDEFIGMANLVDESIDRKLVDELSNLNYQFIEDLNKLFDKYKDIPSSKKIEISAHNPKSDITLYKRTNTDLENNQLENLFLNLVEGMKINLKED